MWFVIYNSCLIKFSNSTLLINIYWPLYIYIYIYILYRRINWNEMYVYSFLSGWLHHRFSYYLYTYGTTHYIINWIHLYGNSIFEGALRHRERQEVNKSKVRELWPWPLFKNLKFFQARNIISPSILLEKINVIILDLNQEKNWKITVSFHTETSYKQFWCSVVVECQNLLFSELP